MSEPTRERAEFIASHLDAGIAHLTHARRSLAKALDAARSDYAHNDTRLANITGGLELVISAAITDRHAWQGYACRREEASPDVQL